MRLFEGAMSVTAELQATIASLQAEQKRMETERQAALEVGSNVSMKLEMLKMNFCGSYIGTAALGNHELVELRLRFLQRVEKCVNIKEDVENDMYEKVKSSSWLIG